MLFFDLMIVHEAQQILRELPYSERLITSWRFAVASGIYRVYMIQFRELIDLALEIVAVFAVPVEQDKRLSPAFFYVKMVNVHVSCSFCLFLDTGMDQFGLSVIRSHSQCSSVLSGVIQSLAPALTYSSVPG